MMRFKRTCVCAMACVSLVAGCSKEQTDSKVEKVSLRLKWLVQAQSAGEILAGPKGFFKDQGLECTVRPGGPDYDSIKLVASGQDDYGVTSADQLLLARSKGIPIVAIGVLFHESPVCYFAKKQLGFTTPRDFEGKAVGVKYGTNAETEYQVLLKRAGIDRERITEVPVKFDMTPFFVDKVQVWPGIESNEPLLAEEKGFPVAILLSRDHGIHTYSNVYFTSEAGLQKHRGQAQRFMKAVCLAWIYARAHEDEAVAAVLTANAQLDRLHEEKALRLTLPIVFPSGEPASFGRMTKEAWERTQSVLLDAGVLHEGMDLDKAYMNILE